MSQITTRNQMIEYVNCRNCGQRVIYRKDLYSIFDEDGSLHVGCKSNVKTYKINPDGSETEIKVPFKYQPKSITCRFCQTKITFIRGTPCNFSGKIHDCYKRLGRGKGSRKGYYGPTNVGLSNESCTDK